MRTKENVGARSGGHRAAFTLLELLTVVSIIGILASVAMPGLNNATQSAKANAAMQQARQIGIGLRGYANDHGGMFPDEQNEFGGAINTANAAFRDLFDYVESEGVFTVKGSNWGKEADEKMDKASDYLRPGENHFAYISGLETTSKSGWPLVVDGTDGKGTYTTERKAKGGLRKGKRGIVIRVDGSGSVEKLGRSQGGDTRFLKRLGEPTENALEVSYMGEGVRLLDPEG